MASLMSGLHSQGNVKSIILWTLQQFESRYKEKLVFITDIRQTEEEVGRQHQEMDRPGVWQVQEVSGSGEQGKMEETGCEIICGALTTLAIMG